MCNIPIEAALTDVVSAKMPATTGASKQYQPLHKGRSGL